MKTSIIKTNNGNTALPARTANNWVDQLFQDNLNRFLMMIFGVSAASSTR